MIFQHTYEWVLGVSPYTGKPKTQTRRILKSGQQLEEVPRGEWGIRCLCVLDIRGHVVYGVGQQLAVQPGRTLKAAGYTDPLRRITQEDVRNISQADAEAEGFKTPADFLELWCEMHDPRFAFLRDTYEEGKFIGSVDGDPHLWTEQELFVELAKRPAERYQAWVLDWGRR